MYRRRRMSRRPLPALLLLVAGCSDDTPVRPKATPDAPMSAPADGPLVLDAAPAKPDAEARDAPPPPDAPPAGPAAVILNELSPNFVAQHDLVELLVTAAGTTAGIQLEQDYPHAPSVLATLPDVVVAASDIIVVHLVPQGTTAMAETRAKDEISTADNFDGAWDVLGGGDDIMYTDVVLAVRAAGGTVTSAVPFFRSDLTDPDTLPPHFPADVQALIDAGLWAETCAPAPCAYGGNLGAISVDWAGAGTSADPSQPSGASVARAPGGRDHHDIADWQRIDLADVAPFNTYGAPN